MNKKYDFSFVLPGFSLNPPGGYMVVFELSRYLVDDGNLVSIIFLKRIAQNLLKLTKDKNIENFFINSLKNKFLSVFLNTLTLRFLNILIKRYPNVLKKTLFPVLGNFLIEFDSNGIDYVVAKEVPKKFGTKRIIATKWDTAYFVDQFQNCKFKYYLAQHNEDDPAFSGALSELARKSYDLRLQKVVINSYMFNRFKDENPIKVTVAAHIRGKVKLTPEERDNNMVLLQLRSGADKGAEYAIEAARMIKEHTPYIKIVSYGNYSGNVPSYIQHYGYVSDYTYIELFNQASVFVLPSLVEGFSTPVLEAMSCGCVPVATECGGPEEMINMMINGILVPIKNSQAICEKVSWLINHKEQRIKMAYEGIATSINYSIEKMGSEFLKGIKKYESRMNGYA